MTPRWLATIFYRSDDGLVDVPHDLEELDEIHAVVEAGPDWNTIDHINIVLQRPSAANADMTLTLEESITQ